MAIQTAHLLNGGRGDCIMSACYLTSSQCRCLQCALAAIEEMIDLLLVRVEPIPICGDRY